MSDEWLEDGGPEDEIDKWTCAFPDRCLMPGEHLRWECYTREMAEEWERDFRAALADKRKGEN
jgi:hypothetical protein